MAIFYLVHVLLLFVYLFLPLKFPNLVFSGNDLLVSMGIESVVDENVGKVSGGVRDGMCSACEMAVVWMQNQLSQNQTQQQILNYVNQVKKFLFMFVFPISVFVPFR